MGRGRRVRLEAGIYRDAVGLAAVVEIQGQRQEKRFEADTDLQLLRIWRADTTSILLKRSQLTSDRGTFARDVARFLRSRRGRAGARADRSHLKPWVLAFGRGSRHHITRAAVLALLARWTADGLAPRTLRHRVRVLREVLEHGDPDQVPPLRKLKLPRPAKTAPIPVSQDVIAAVAESLAAGLTREHRCGPKKTPTVIRRAVPLKTFARFLVYATCGQRPAQIGRAEPGDVQCTGERTIWYVRPAKGGDPIVLPLNDDMTYAWEVFAAAEAWGAFNASSFAKTLRRHGWPTGVPPYRLRHTFAIDLLLQGVPLETLQGLLGHQHIGTTRIYAPVQLALSQEAIGRRALQLRTRAVPRAVPRRVSVARENAREIKTSLDAKKQRSGGGRK
jgi:integrase/recombinase XerD